jgi:hypothetical protein
VQVEQDQVRLDLVVQGHNLRRVGEALDVAVPGLFENALQEDDVDPLVVLDQDPGVCQAWGAQQCDLLPLLLLLCWACCRFGDDPP